MGFNNHALFASPALGFNIGRLGAAKMSAFGAKADITRPLPIGRF